MSYPSKQISLRIFLTISIAAIIVLALSGLKSNQVSAQSSEILWGPAADISNSPGNTSTDPFLISDPTGKVHLFWAEKGSSIPGNQPDTVMYSTLDGNVWSKPIDIFFSPESDGTPVVAYPRAVIDDRGYLHLIWLAQPHFPRYALYYSSVYLPRSSDVHAWRPRVVLADDLSGTKYSADIAFSPEQGLNIMYARVQQGDNLPEERAVTYIKSTDYGTTWTDPVDIDTISDLNSGASDVRLLLEPPNNIYTSWTRWDVTGNGQAIVFDRSVDNGQTWDPPQDIATRIGDEYERDWNNMTLLGPGQIVTMFEGGWRAYRYAMYSYDSGVTWSDPIDTFPWLIGENGTVEYVRDSNGTLHLFIAQRVREGYSRGDLNLAALWHSEWEGGTRWSEPEFVGALVNLINPKVTIAGGNRIVATWYTQNDLEIMTMIGTIQNAPAVDPQTLPTEIPAATATPEPLTVLEATQPVQVQSGFTVTPGDGAPGQPGVPIAIGVSISFLLIAVAVILIFRRR
jgi:hypothetical protein